MSVQVGPEYAASIDGKVYSVRIAVDRIKMMHVDVVIITIRLKI